MVTLPNGASFDMQWNWVKYSNHDDFIIFDIYPMFRKPDLVLVPTKENYGSVAWIFPRREMEDAISLLNSIQWRRQIKVLESDYEPVANQDIEIKVGMLEHVPAYSALAAHNVFDPDSPVTEEEAQKLYYRLEERFAEAAHGTINVPKDIIIKGSVLEKVTLKTLKKNKKVTLNYV